MPTIATSRNTAANKKGGSGYFWLKFVLVSGADLSTPDTVHAGFIGKDSGFDESVSEEKDKDEGRNEYLQDTTTSSTFELTPMQFDPATLDLARQLRDGLAASPAQYVQILKSLNEKPIDGNYLFALIAVAEYVSGGVYKSGVITPLKFNLIKPAADITVALSGTTAPGFPVTPTGDIICPSTEFYGYATYTPA